MPSQPLLEEALHEIFHLQDADGAITDAELLSVGAGISMNRDYVCYSAVFGLPAGVFAAQGTYRVSRGNGESWSLFMAPIQPDATGKTRVEALFHYHAAQSSGTTVSMQDRANQN